MQQVARERGSNLIDLTSSDRMPLIPEFIQLLLLIKVLVSGSAASILPTIWKISLTLSTHAREGTILSLSVSQSFYHTIADLENGGLPNIERNIKQSTGQFKSFNIKNFVLFFLK